MFYTIQDVHGPRSGYTYICRMLWRHVTCVKLLSKLAIFLYTIPCECISLFKYVKCHTEMCDLFISFTNRWFYEKFHIWCGGEMNFSPFSVGSCALSTFIMMRMVNVLLCLPCGTIFNLAILSSNAFFEHLFLNRYVHLPWKPLQSNDIHVQKYSWLNYFTVKHM